MPSFSEVADKRFMALFTDKKMTELMGSIDGAVFIYMLLRAGNHYPKVWMKKKALSHAKRKLRLVK